MNTPNKNQNTLNPTTQAALTARALERIAADLLAILPELKGEQAAKVEEAAAEIWAHSDALLIAGTQETIDRLTGANARIIR